MNEILKNTSNFKNLLKNKISPGTEDSHPGILFRSIRCLLMICVMLVHAGLTASAETSPVQSSARPFGLDIVGPVQLAGSDADSAVFQSETLPTMNELINTSLSENTSIEDTSSISLDPSNLYLATESDVRVYFVGEGAGYHNTLGFNVDGGGISSGDPLLIFPDATSSDSYLGDVSNTGVRSASAPLLPGDFVDLGNFEAGTQLDFFLIANGANGGTNVFSTDTSVNPDGINHVYALADSPYLLIGFEDLYGGGDLDFNDLLFVVDIGTANVNALTNAPEPSTLMSLGSFILFAMYLERRKKHFHRQETRT